MGWRVDPETGSVSLVWSLTRSCLLPGKQGGGHGSISGSGSPLKGGGAMSQSPSPVDPPFSDTGGFSRYGQAAAPVPLCLPQGASLNGPSDELPLCQFLVLWERGKLRSGPLNDAAAREFRQDLSPESLLLCSPLQPVVVNAAAAPPGGAARATGAAAAEAAGGAGGHPAPHWRNRPRQPLGTRRASPCQREAAQMSCDVLLPT